MSVEVLESFDGYQPPRWVRPAVEEMLDSIPEKYLLGLQSVILTNHASMNRAHRRGKTISRSRKIPISHSAGTYHQKWHGKPAFIRIYLERNLLQNGIARNVPILREVSLALTLFHEVGHHIHHTSRPEYLEREDVADKWSGRLFGNFMRKTHPLLFWVLMFPIAKLVRRHRKSAARRR